MLLSPRPFFVLDSVSVSRLLLFIADCNFSLKIKCKPDVMLFITAMLIKTFAPIRLSTLGGCWRWRV